MHPWPELNPELLVPVPEREELRQIVREVLAKHADHEQVRAAADSAAGYSEDLWRLLNAELEISRLAVPEALGGNGFGLQELFVVVEECGAALTSEPVLSSAVLGCQALVAADDPARVEDLLEPALRGELLVTVAFGTDPLTAVLDAEGGWHVSGSRTRVLHGAAAGLVVVDAATPQGTVLLAVAASDFVVEPRTTVDFTRRQADLAFDAAAARPLVGVARATTVRDRLALIGHAALAAEHAGIVGELLERTCEYVTPTSPVRARHRIVPSDQAPAGRRARRSGARSLRQPVRRRRPRRGARDRGPPGRGRRRRLCRRGDADSARGGAAARRHRIHLGAPRPLLRSPRARRRRALRCHARAPGSHRRARRGLSRSSFRPRCPPLRLTVG